MSPSPPRTLEMSTVKKPLASEGALNWRDTIHGDRDPPRDSYEHELRFEYEALKKAMGAYKRAKISADVAGEQLAEADEALKKIKGRLELDKAHENISKNMRRPALE